MYRVRYELDADIFAGVDIQFIVQQSGERSRVDARAAGVMYAAIDNDPTFHVCQDLPGDAGRCATVPSLNELPQESMFANLNQFAQAMKALRATRFFEDETEPREIAGQQVDCYGFEEQLVPNLGLASDMEVCVTSDGIVLSLEATFADAGHFLISAQEVHREVDELVFFPPFPLVPFDQLDLR